MTQDEGSTSPATEAPQLEPTDAELEPTEADAELEPTDAEPEPTETDAELEPTEADAELEPTEAGPDPSDEARRRLLRAMRPRATRGQLLAGALCAVLGFAFFVQARQTQAQGLASLRPSDLVSILDNVTERAARLDDEARQLQATQDRLRSGSDRSAAAEDAARQRLAILGILAGTAPAIGPGIELTIEDSHGVVKASDLLDALQELRDAGAEAVQVATVRVVASTSFEDDVDGAGVRVDGQLVTPPYHLLVIGDAQTLAAALDIPGGVLESLKQNGALGTVSQRQSVRIDALRSAKAPQYARPSPAPSASP